MSLLLPFCVLNSLSWPHIHLALRNISTAQENSRKLKVSNEDSSISLNTFTLTAFGLADTKRLLCDIHHPAQDCSKFGLSDKYLKLIMRLLAFTLKTLIKLRWQSCDEISGSGKCWAGFESPVVWAQGNSSVCGAGAGGQDSCQFSWL